MVLAIAISCLKHEKRLIPHLQCDDITTDTAVRDRCWNVIFEAGDRRPYDASRSETFMNPVPNTIASDLLNEVLAHEQSDYVPSPFEFAKLKREVDKIKPIDASQHALLSAALAARPRKTK